MQRTIWEFSATLGKEISGVIQNGEPRGALYIGTTINAVAEGTNFHTHITARNFDPPSVDDYLVLFSEALMGRSSVQFLFSPEGVYTYKCFAELVTEINILLQKGTLDVWKEKFRADVKKIYKACRDPINFYQYAHCMEQLGVRVTFRFYEDVDEEDEKYVKADATTILT